VTGRPGDDESELLALSGEYAAAVDDRDGGRFAALFTGDGELVVPLPPEQLAPVRTLTGADVLRSVPSGLARYEWTLHQVVDGHFAVQAPATAPPSATGRVRGLAHHVRASDRPGAPAAVDTVWYLTYLDTYRREADRWRIARRELHLHWVEERPVTVLAHRAGTGRGGGGPT
jgi:hypothetical protein